MANIATIRLDVTVDGPNGVVQAVDQTYRTAVAAGLAGGDRRTYACSASSFTTLTVPTGAKWCLIFLPSSAESMVLKNVTGDTTGIKLTPASNPRECACLLALGDSPGLGLLNSGSGTENVEVLFL